MSCYVSKGSGGTATLICNLVYRQSGHFHALTTLPKKEVELRTE